MPRYTIIAAAALAAGLLPQIQVFACPSSISAPTVTPPSSLNLGRPDHNPQPMSVRSARLIVLAGLVFGLGAGEVGDKATLSKRH